MKVHTSMHAVSLTQNPPSQVPHSGNMPVAPERASPIDTKAVQLSGLIILFFSPKDSSSCIETYKQSPNCYLGSEIGPIFSIQTSFSSMCVHTQACIHSACAIFLHTAAFHLVLMHVTPLLSYSFFSPQKGFHKEDKSKNHSIVWEHWGPFNSLWDIKAHSKTLHY